MAQKSGAATIKPYMKASFENMIGVLTESIRGSWNDTWDRLNAIIKLCGKLGRQDWIDQIENNADYIRDDGRWFRDVWTGPYGGDLFKVDDKTLDEYYGLLPYPPYDNLHELREARREKARKK